MHPQLWTLPILGLPIYAYGFMVMLGFLAGIFVASRRAKKLGLNPEIILDLGIITMIAGIIGARLAYIIIFWSQFTLSWEIFNIFDGNLNMYGGIAGWFIPYAIFRLRKSPRKGIGGNRPREGVSPNLPFPPRRPPIRILRTFIWLFLASFISAIIVARIVYLIIHRADYDFFLFQVWKGGLVFYGGIILAIPAGIYYISRVKQPTLVSLRDPEAAVPEPLHSGKKKGLKVGEIADLVAPSIALGLALGRIGCFLNGCCYGMAAPEHKWALPFPMITHQVSGEFRGNPIFKITQPETGEILEIIGSPAFKDHLAKGLVTQESLQSLPVHPTQIYESLFALLLFVILSLIWRKKKKDGLVFGGLVLFYAVGRFIIEFFRGDKGPVLWGLTDSQIISVGLFAFALIFLVYILRRHKSATVQP